MTFKQNLRYALLSSTMGVLSLMPLCFHRACGRFVGFVVRSVVKYRRKVVEDNIAAAFPEKSAGEREDIMKRYYRSLGTIVCEAIWFGSCAWIPGRLKRSRIVDMEGQEIINSCLDEGRSVVVLTSHNGNFEIVSGFSTYASYTEPLHVSDLQISEVYRSLSDPVWDKFLGRNRKAGLSDRKNYDAMVETANALRFVYAHRNDRMIFNFITDQYPYGEEIKALDVTFLGRKTKTMVGGAAIARKLNFPLFYMNMECRPGGGYRMKFTPMFENPAEASLQEIVDRYYSLLEEDVRKQPWNYLWSHRRWK